ncbi:substrate-binding domain-containing protein [Microbacterium kribbense]|uniref:substrate-binding domain-containing protein n=1 Tax=Microbacterium kribbense TaxID=433645 RepID=UPI0031DF656E
MATPLARDRGIDAVFAASDRMAVGAISALRRARRRLPDDVAGAPARSARSQAALIIAARTFAHASMHAWQDCAHILHTSL